MGGVGDSGTIIQLLNKFFDPAEPRLYLVGAGGGHGHVRVLLAVACRPAPPAVLADGVAGREEYASDFAPLALPAALGPLADFSPLELGFVNRKARFGHCFPQLVFHKDLFLSGFAVSSVCGGTSDHFWVRFPNGADPMLQRFS